jgi:hypothetical protein
VQGLTMNTSLKLEREKNGFSSVWKADMFTL